MPHTLWHRSPINGSVRAASAGTRTCSWGDLMQVLKKGLFLAAAVPLARALALPLAAAFAQSSEDAAYCQSLSASVRTVTRGNTPSGPTGDALAGCNSNPSASIPVLEKLLMDNKVSLPPRPSMAPPPPPFNAKAYKTAAECLTAAYAAKQPLSVCKM